MVRIQIRMLRITFEWFEFDFECFKSLSNLHSNALNAFRMVRICIRMLRIWLVSLDFAFESLSYASNPCRMVRIGIQML